MGGVQKTEEMLVPLEQAAFASPAQFFAQTLKPRILGSSVDATRFHDGLRPLPVDASNFTIFE